MDGSGKPGDPRGMYVMPSGPLAMPLTLTDAVCMERTYAPSPPIE